MVSDDETQGTPVSVPSTLSESAAQFVRDNPTDIEVTAAGKIRFLRTGMEFKASCDGNDLMLYMKGRAMRRAIVREANSEFDFKALEPNIVPHKEKNPDAFLYCVLTRRTLPKNVTAVQKHISGKKYVSALKKQEAVNAQLELLQRKRRERALARAVANSNGQQLHDETLERETETGNTIHRFDSSPARANGSNNFFAKDGWNSRKPDGKQAKVTARHGSDHDEEDTSSMDNRSLKSGVLSSESCASDTNDDEDENESERPGEYMPNEPASTYEISCFEDNSADSEYHEGSDDSDAFWFRARAKPASRFSSDNRIPGSNVSRAHSDGLQSNASNKDKDFDSLDIARLKLGLRKRQRDEKAVPKKTRQARNKLRLASEDE